MKSCLLILEDCNCPCVGKGCILKIEIRKNSSANKKKIIILHPFRDVELISSGF